MSTARRISVVGSTGSGKTTLARDLSVHLGLIFYELDVLRGEYTGKSPAYSGFAEAVAELVQNEGWIIDGHYRDVRHLIWQRSDLVVHLNYSLMLIVARLVNRFVGKWRGDGSSGGAGGSASWTRRFARMAKTIRERREYAKIFNGPNFADLTVIELKSPHATREWLAGLEPAPHAKADSEATTANAPS